MKIDKKLIKELVDNLKEFALTELEYQEGQTKIKVSRASKPVDPIIGSSIASPNKVVLQTSNNTDGIRVKSPIMIVEAMKTMNHVPSTADGEVKKILVEDSQPVEFGQTLILLK